MERQGWSAGFCPAFTPTPETERRATRLPSSAPLLTAECREATSVNSLNGAITTFGVWSESAERQFSSPQASFLPSAGPFHILFKLRFVLNLFSEFQPDVHASVTQLSGT